MKKLMVMAKVFALCVVPIFFGARLYAGAGWAITSDPSNEPWLIPGTYYCGWYENGICYYFQSEEYATCRVDPSSPSDSPVELEVKPSVTVSYRGKTYTFKCLLCTAANVDCELWTGTIEDYQENYHQKYGRYPNIGGTCSISARYPTKRIIFDDAFQNIPTRFDCPSVQSIVLPKNPHVKEIANEAFLKCRSLIDIDMPNTITSIGCTAFSGCSNLTSVVWPKDLRTIGDSAFGASGINSAILPDGVEYIGNRAFYSCDNLEEVYIADSCTNIGASAFSHCSKLKSVRLSHGIPSLPSGLFVATYSLCDIEIPDSVKSIENEAFFNSSLERVTLPDSVEDIGTSAFSLCTNLVEVSLSHSLTNISSEAFSDCDKLASITIPPSVESIGNRAFGSSSWRNKWRENFSVSFEHGAGKVCTRAFYGLYSLTNVSMPDTVTNIESYAFYSCKNLPSVMLPKNLKHIEKMAFYECISLKSITIPASVKQISEYAFGRCDSLSEIIFEGLPPSSETSPSSDTETLIVSGYTTGVYPSAYKDEWEKVIKNGYWRGLKMMSQQYSTTDPTPDPEPDPTPEPEPEPVTPEPEPMPAPEPNPTPVPVVTQQVFMVTFDANGGSVSPDSITVAKDAAVGTLPEATLIGYKFEGWWTAANGGSQVASSTKVTTNVTYYAHWSANGGGSEPEPEVATPIFIIEDGVLIACDPNGATDVVIPDGVIAIGSWAFSLEEGYRLRRITIPLGVMSIGEGAFCGCSGLANMVIPAGVTSIGDAAFSGCSGLLEVVIPDSVTDIGEYAFDGCGGLRSLTIPGSIASLRNGMFSSCSNLTSVVIPDNVVSIGDSVFANCKSLSSIAMPNRVANIGEWAFSGCVGLVSVIIPDSVISIGYQAFLSCKGLKSVSLPKHFKGVDNSIFDDCSAELVITYRDDQPEPTPDPVTPDPVTPGPVNPELGIDYGGAVDNVEFTKAQAVIGALYDAKGNLAGTVELKFGKINKKQVVKVSGSATLITDGKAKKITAKAVNVTVDATKRVPPTTIAFKAPIGDMAFAMDADGVFTLKNEKYEMVNETVGGAMPNGTVHFNVDMDSVPDFGKDGSLLEVALPVNEPIKVSGGKWSFGKAASLKYAKNKAIGSYELIGRNDPAKPNVSGLKLTYTAKTGLFKGSFKLYATNEATTPSGKAPKLKKYTVNVIGFVVDGKGYGEATLKKPAGAWVVTVQ